VVPPPVPLSKIFRFQSLATPSEDGVHCSVSVLELPSSVKYSMSVLIGVPGVPLASWAGKLPANVTCVVGAPVKLMPATLTGSTLERASRAGLGFTVVPSGLSWKPMR